MNTRTRPEPAVGRTAGVLSSLGALPAALLVPKCPLCVAAWLGALGMGASSAAALAPYVRPFGLALGAAALLVGLWFGVRRARRRALPAPKCCCQE